jgi:tetratricopeptide (TPR) repeat protein
MHMTRRPRDGVAEARRLAERGRTAARSGTPVEALGWFDRALAVLHVEPAGEMLADVLRWKGTAHRECGDTAAADRLYQESGEVAERIGYLAGAAHAANCRGIVAQRRGELGDAERLYARASALAEQAGEVPLSVMVQRNLGIVGSIRGDWAGAVERFEESRRKAEAMGDDDGVGRALNNIAIVHTKQERFAEAEELYGRALALARECGDAVSECIYEFNRAEMLIAARRLDDASRACAVGLDIAERRGDRLRRAEGLKLLAIIGRLNGDTAACEALLEEALALADTGEDQCLHAEVLRERARLLRMRGQLEQARRSLRAARDRFVAVGARPEIRGVNRELAELQTAV